MKTNKAKIVKTEEDFIRSAEQIAYERKWRKRALETDIKCMERAIAFKKMEIETGQILETMENFKGMKPSFIIENEIDINEFNLEKKREEMKNLIEVENAENSKLQGETSNK